MIDVKMWGRALAQMPKLSQSEWQALDPVAKWLVACRASVLFMTFTASALGGLMAWRVGLFDWNLWLATVLGLMFAHATNNLLNDYTDSRRGIDRDNYYRNQYGVHVLEDGLMSERTVLALCGGHRRYCPVAGRLAGVRAQRAHHRPDAGGGLLRAVLYLATEVLRPW